jgi:hypothetical protein
MIQASAIDISPLMLHKDEARVVDAWIDSALLPAIANGAIHMNVNKKWSWSVPCW